jgi:hypothetical protein
MQKMKLKLAFLFLLLSIPHSLDHGDKDNGNKTSTSSSSVKGVISIGGAGSVVEAFTAPVDLVAMLAIRDSFNGTYTDNWYNQSVLDPCGNSSIGVVCKFFTLSVYPLTSDILLPSSIAPYLPVWDHLLYIDIDALFHHDFNFFFRRGSKSPL